MTTHKRPPAAPGDDAEATGYLKIEASDDPRDVGRVIPDTPESRERYGANARPATVFETGVAGYMTRKA